MIPFRVPVPQGDHLQSIGTSAPETTRDAQLGEVEDFRIEFEVEGRCSVDD